MKFFTYVAIFIAGVWVGYQFIIKPIVVRNRRQTKQKEENKEKILSLFNDKKDELSNNDVEDLLDVADSTATKYLNELEKENKILQKGRTGRGVVYIKRLR